METMTGHGMDPLLDPELPERLGRARRAALAHQHIDEDFADQVDAEHAAAELLATDAMRQLVVDLERKHRYAALFALAEEFDYIATQIEDTLARFPRDQTTDMEPRDPAVCRWAACKARGFYLDIEQHYDPDSAWHKAHDPLDVDPDDADGTES